MPMTDLSVTSLHMSYGEFMSVLREDAVYKNYPNRVGLECGLGSARKALAEYLGVAEVVIDDRTD